MNRQIELITFPYSSAKFSIFSLTKKNVECFKCRILSNKKYDYQTSYPQEQVVCLQTLLVF